MRLIALCLLCAFPLSARADAVVDRVLDDVALPGVAAFAKAARTLADAAAADCTPDTLKSPWNAAMDAWFGIQDLRVGPLDTGSRRQAIAYWPDPKGYRPRTLSRILSGQDPIPKTGDYADEAVPARGLYALETMLYDPAFARYTASDPGCLLVQAASADLARTAQTVLAEWENGFADAMRTAGADGNPRFLDPAEARQAVFTALMTSLQFDSLERLGLPLGTAATARPTRAEARLSGRSQRNLALSIAGHDRLARALVPGPMLRTEFGLLSEMAAGLDDRDFSGVGEPAGRARLAALQTALMQLRARADLVLGTALGVTMGLNALDGD